YDEFRTKTLSDCSDMSDDDDNDNFEILTARYDGASSLTADELDMTTPASTELEDKAGVAFVMDEGALSRYHRGAEERTRQRAQGRNIREALQMAPDQSRIKYLEQLLSESSGRCAAVAGVPAASRWIWSDCGLLGGMSGAESGDEALLLAAMGFAAFGKPRRSQQRHEAEAETETVGLPQLMPGTELASQQAAFPSGSVEAGDHGVLYLLTREPQDGSDLELAAALRGEAGEGGVGQKVEERALLETLATEKRKFDALESARFLRARAATNRFEGLGRHRFVNRSAMKLVTLDHIFKWTRKLPREREAWSFADICGGPGGFAEYLLWRGEQEKSEGADDTLRVRGYGISLKDAANDCDWRVPPQPHALFQACYGQDGTGNLYSLANIHCFRDLVRGQHPLGVDLAVADGGFLEARSQANQVQTT
ncbi:hypothetical protein BBJ28_00000344, partial [Nothophytophthora sp. Chile5]